MEMISADLTTGQEVGRIGLLAGNLALFDNLKMTGEVVRDMTVPGEPKQKNIDRHKGYHDPSDFSNPSLSGPFSNGSSNDAAAPSDIAQPHPKGVVGKYNFFDDFDHEGLSANLWKYSVQEHWPPGSYRRYNVPDGVHFSNPYEFRLDGNTHVSVKNGKLIQYVLCSRWYDTLRSWPLWVRPKLDPQLRFYVYVWGLQITPLQVGFERHPKNTGEIGFIVALCDEYDQSLFHDRRNYFAIKGLQPLSIGFEPLEGTNPGPSEAMRLCTEHKRDGRVDQLSMYADEYVKVGDAVDLSWAISKRQIVARWKPTGQKRWRVLQRTTDSNLRHLRLQFGCSWAEYLTDAVQVTDRNLSTKLRDTDH